MPISLRMLRTGNYRQLLIHPRWPARVIWINPVVLARLENSQSRLPSGMKLILTRGFESANSRTGRTRQLLRLTGKFAFLLIYPTRHQELDDIFSSNGHDKDGTHFDVSIAIKGKRLSTLPFGVFTPIWLQKRRMRALEEILNETYAALATQGIKTHKNQTERLQIHCELEKTNRYIT
jgi:hypothetical protein